MSETIRVLLADDHALVRELLAVRLQAGTDGTAAPPGSTVAVVASVADSDALLSEARRTRPDLAVLDIDMPGPPVFGVVARLRHELPGLRVLFLSAFVNDHHVQQALDLGAAGYVCKTDPVERIVAAVRSVARGAVAYSAAVRDRIVIEAGGRAVLKPQHSRLELLTPREMEVLAVMARGSSKKEAAAALSISHKTVDRHCVNLMEKLAIHDRVELARFAIREGVVNP
jgi:DNA-binding NarL/FixJ family response regulator